MESVTKIKSIDLFAGCGGLMDGFELSGKYSTIACVEWEKAACENLTNRLENKWRYSDAKDRVFRFDIQRTDELLYGWQCDSEYGTSKGLIKQVEEHSGIDLIIGGPPCQAYSLALRNREGNGIENDYRNFLFESYIRVVDCFKPKVFVFENVPGILSANPKGIPILEMITEGFSSIGYAVPENLKDMAVIDFTEYGIPQNRKRVIIVGLRKDCFRDYKKTLEIFYREYLPQFKCNTLSTVQQAIGDLPKFYPSKEPYKVNGRNFSHFPCESSVPNHTPRYHNQRDIAIFKILAHDIRSGQNKFTSSEALKKIYKSFTGKESNVHKYYVLRENEPGNTIPAHLYKDGLRHIHPDPEQARSITVREAARLQTFDDDYAFTGSIMDQYKMIGNAVPPNFAKKLALAVSKLF